MWKDCESRARHPHSLWSKYHCDWPMTAWRPRAAEKHEAGYPVPLTETPFASCLLRNEVAPCTLRHDFLSRDRLPNVHFYLVCVCPDFGRLLLFSLQPETSIRFPAHLRTFTPIYCCYVTHMRTLFFLFSGESHSKLTQVGWEAKCFFGRLLTNAGEGVT